MTNTTDNRKRKASQRKAGKKKQAVLPSGNSNNLDSAEARQLGQKHYEVLNGLPVLTVALTGAGCGSLLKGVIRTSGSSSNDSEGVILKIESGHVKASSAICAPLSQEELIEAYVRGYGISRAVATQQVQTRRMTDPALDNAHPIGSSCPTAKGIHFVYGNKDGEECDCEALATFRILDPGKWVQIADDFGNKDQLMRYVIEGTILTWRQILKLFGNKTLMLRPRLFSLTMGPTVVSCPSEHAIDCRLISEGDNHLSETYDVGLEGERMEITVNKSTDTPEPNTKSRALELVKTACPPNQLADDDTLERLYDALYPLTSGALKSAMQKSVRFGARHVSLEDNFQVSSSDFAAMSTCILALNPGGFVPQIQQVVRGIVAALKRSVVIAVEDSFAGHANMLQGMLGTALVCHRVRTYCPPTFVITMCIRLMWDLARSHVRIDWQPHLVKKGVSSPIRFSAAKRILPKTVVAESMALRNPTDAIAFQNVAMLLEELRSFQGDIDMMHTVARMAKNHNHLPILRATKQPTVMPFCHIMDQHTQPGIGHVMRGDLESFHDRFQVLFDKVTGVNPRRDDMNDEFESREEVVMCRFAQRVVMQFVTKKPRTALPVVKKRSESFHVDPGTLAAGVGPVECSVKLDKRKKLALLVTLPTIWPHQENNESTTEEDPEEVVMLQPTRANVEDYLEWGNKEDPEELKQSELERQAARTNIREKNLRVSSPLLPSGHATFVNGAWHFNDRPWRQWMREGVPVEVDLHENPKWPTKLDPVLLLQNDEVLLEALAVTGTGMCKRARRAVLAICDRIPSQIVSRAHGVLRQQYEKVNMPTPARDGGLGADQLQAYPGDWDVWRLLVLFSRLVPGGLRPAIPPRFDVPNAALLSMLTSWISGRREGQLQVANDSMPCPAIGISATPWSARSEWGAAYRKATEILRQHQQDAVERMKHRHLRGAPGHYLVMDTGHGKTYTALTYAMWRLLHTDLGGQIQRIIWVTPPGEKLDKKGKAGEARNYQLIKSLMDELETDEALIQVPVSFVDKKEKCLARMFPPYTVCIAHHDHIRSMPEKLVEVAKSSFFIFDEGDNFYGPSQRTSMALRLATLCPEFIIQTATPVPGRGKLERLAEWLGLTEEYPVTRRNYLVAACNMVSLKVSLGIESVYLEHKVARSVGAEQAFRDYVRTRDWGSLFRILQQETNRAFCERARYNALQDRKETPTGGCFVVCEGERHVKELLALFREMYQDLRAGDAKDMTDSKVGVVFVSSKNNRGYNTGVRLGVQIRQPYPGSGASRQQMEGRIRRMNQKRPRVSYEVVYIAGTLMELLHDRQQRDDNANHSLDQLAEEYDRSVIEFSKSGSKDN